MSEERLTTFKYIKRRLKTLNDSVFTIFLIVASSFDSAFSISAPNSSSITWRGKNNKNKNFLSLKFFNPIVKDYEINFKNNLWRQKKLDIMIKGLEIGINLGLKTSNSGAIYWLE